jgi:GPH family glycoside/pentoside/hexuronide:cation symporter
MLIMVMFMNFATDVLRIAPGVVGSLFFVAKIWDAITDPLVGNWSDRTHSRFGRRRSWMLAACVPIAAFNVMLWAPPATLQGASLVIWIGVALLGFYTAYTAFSVPHMALGAELHSDGLQRNRIFGVRQITFSVGMLLAFVLGTPLLENPGEARDRAAIMAWIAGGVTAVTIVFFLLRLPSERSDYAGRGGHSPIASLRDVWHNPHARLLLFVFFVETFGMGGVTVMTPYVMKYVVRVEGVIGLVLLCYVLPTVLSIPVWVWLGGRFQRHKLWIFAMGMSCIAYSLLVFQAEGRVWLMVLVSSVAGTAGGCGATLGQAIKADVIDFDEYATGERKEGSYFAAWNFVAKLAMGLMVALSGFALQWSGFEPGVEQTPLTINTILFMMGGMPFLGFLIGMLAFTRFGLTREEHARIRRELDQRSRDAAT